MRAVRLSLVLPVVVFAMAVASCALGQAHPCKYQSIRSGEMELATVCGDLYSGEVAFPERLRRDLRFENNGLSAVWQKNDWFYVNRHGRAVPVLTFDNGPDYFSEGLARSNNHGHVTFIDRSLRPVLVTPYTWASPFRHGRADVCLGCVKQQVHPGSKHTMMTGGEWRVINRTGRVVVPTRSPQNNRR